MYIECIPEKCMSQTHSGLISILDIERDIDKIEFLSISLFDSTSLGPNSVLQVRDVRPGDCCGASCCLKVLLVNLTLIHKIALFCAICDVSENISFRI